MGMQDRVKPISFLKANSAEIIRDLGKGGGAMIITQNGEAKAVLQDIGSYEAMQETLALLKLLALGRQDIDAGRTVPVKGLADRIRKRA